MQIKNALCYQNDSFVKKDIHFQDGFFCQHSKEQSFLDAKGCYVIPGLIDLHFHGCNGADFCNHTKAALDCITAYEAQNGITSICPATMTLPYEELALICQTAASYENSSGAVIRGINLEGPFLSPKKKGAQDSTCMCNAAEPLFTSLQKESNGLIKLITIAPEIAKNIDFIRAMKDRVRICIGHSSADYETAKAAFAAGALQVTHLFNAMSPFHHRDPGIVGAALDSPGVTAELICDGIHLHPSMIRAAFSMFTKERIILISDSMEATGLSSGTYQLGGQRVSVHDNKAVLDDGSIAGSVSNLMDCVRYLVKKAGIPLAAAIRCATENPARAIGIYDICGSITNGKTADLVLLDQSLDVVAVFLHGKQIYISK